MRGLLLILSLMYSLAAIAQPGESIMVKHVKPLDFSYKSIDELSYPKVINDALELKVKVRNEGLNIYASLDVSHANKKALNNMLVLHYSHATSPNVNIANSDVPLTNTPVLLFYQPGTDKNVQNFSYQYDLILNPFTTFANVGYCNYSIVFTLTKQ